VSPRATPPSAATLRKRFEAYEAALRSHRSLGETLRLDAPIEASIERFAIAWTGTETARAVQAKNSRAQERTTASSSRKALAARTPLARLEAAAADFVTPGDLLHSASLVTVGQVAVPAPKRRRAKRAARKPMPRTTLTRAEVEREIVTMLAKLAPGWKTSDITSTTRLEQDFGFDEWGILRVVPPIRRRFQIDVPDGLVRRARTVGDLVKLVWDRLEDAP
jgi:acyl carrier protein